MGSPRAQSSMQKLVDNKLKREPFWRVPHCRTRGLEPRGEQIRQRPRFRRKHMQCVWYACMHGLPSSGRHPLRRLGPITRLRYHRCATTAGPSRRAGSLSTQTPTTHAIKLCGWCQNEHQCPLHSHNGRRPASCQPVPTETTCVRFFSKQSLQRHSAEHQQGMGRGGKNRRLIEEAVVLAIHSSTCSAKARSTVA